MAIQVGDKIPSVTLKTTDLQDVQTDDLFAGKVVLIIRREPVARDGRRDFGSSAPSVGHGRRRVGRRTSTDK